MKRIALFMAMLGILGLLGKMIKGRDECPPPPCAKKIAVVPVVRIMPLSSAHLK